MSEVALWRAAIEQARIDALELPEMAVSTSDWLDVIDAIKWWCRGGRDLIETFNNADIDPDQVRAAVCKRLREQARLHRRAAKELYTIARDFEAVGLHDDALESNRIAGFRLDAANTIERELKIAV